MFKSLFRILLTFQICANDDLVAKKFAYYGKESADSGGMDAVDRCPIMLSSSLLGQTGSTTSVKLTAQSPLRPGKHTHVTSCSGIVGCKKYTDSRGTLVDHYK